MEARFSTPVHTGPGAHPASCTMGTGSFPGVKSDRGVTLTPHPILVPWSRKGRAIPLLHLWAVRPVKSLGACTRVTFTFIAQTVYTACKRIHYRIVPVTNLNKIYSMVKRHPTDCVPVMLQTMTAPLGKLCAGTRDVQDNS